MTVTLKIEVTSPLTDDDRDLLAGLAVMTVAIANRQLNMEEQPPEPTECGELEYVDEPSGPQATGRICDKDPHHVGRHRFRQAPVLAMVN